MKIIDSNVQTKANYRMETTKETTERLEVWQESKGADIDAAYVVDLGHKPDQHLYNAPKTQAVTCADLQTVDDQNTDVKLKLVESLIYQMTGKTVKLHSPELALNQAQTVTVTMQPSVTQEKRDGWGLVYEYQETVTEKESVQYNAAGMVTIADGKTIAFELAFILSREFFEQTRETIQMGDAAKVDPLVVVISGNAPVLSEAKQDFDIDSDGEMDQISFATGGSGFLAIDKNGDGQINNGTELFGPQSGDGFEELRFYDQDGNGWIDEADDVFGKLSILSSDKDGQRTLVKISDVGIGAIYLQSTATPFGIRDAANDYGVMRSSSVYLQEDGTAGTIHHIDLSL